MVFLFAVFGVLLVVLAVFAAFGAIRDLVTGRNSAATIEENIERDEEEL
ncbi:hypothetical protein AA103196_1300 [Ameyamaea chiangmaiensis NBRC 103196]|uniref:Uncharacterized protein n=1 Tax=Ameyamaea chiangmaiensis TaxID=442969 RepID=A0A850PFK1_9PROT|nr:hypothetical protein [Ameyamaea chiangmaiensis]MBS4075120.1 hypothetical protein [Ameyamaea chiangmaiensis]NVN40682.1 hypothetical protein [Ameyamaea chiangmaiensis]GBQ66130.1 hypothetical protein AA103196_1300 [Ameyamaea chiangmaiensis NBRC 103196]